MTLAISSAFAPVPKSTTGADWRKWRKTEARGNEERVDTLRQYRYARSLRSATGLAQVGQSFCGWRIPKKPQVAQNRLTAANQSRSLFSSIGPDLRLPRSVGPSFAVDG